MAKRKVEAAEKLVTVQAAVPLIIWRANRPLTASQHEELAEKLRSEKQHVGVELLLVPYSTDIEIALQSVEVKDATKEPEPTSKKSDDTPADADTPKDQTETGE